MQLIYNNFDGLDISFQGALPESVLNQLNAAKEEAQQERREIYVELGENKVSVMVAETGARGGYRYCFDTGLDGEVWFIAHSTNSDLWNIRVSVKSLKLALSGYKAVKTDILKRLIALQAVGKSIYPEGLAISGKPYYGPTESISRVDYCFDFIMDEGFMPSPENFVAHQRVKKHVYSEKIEQKDYSAWRGDKVETIRLGEMPGRQATVYNKLCDINAKDKQYWWDIWKLDREEFKKSGQNIWRIEVRAGKNELDKWNLKRFDDFEEKIGDVIGAILKAIRYTTPISDNNRSRWPMHPLWEFAYSISYKALFPYRNNAIRGKIINDYRENVINGYKDRLIGNLIGLIAAQGRDISEIPATLEEFEALIEKSLIEDQAIMVKKFEKAEERFKCLL